MNRHLTLRQAAAHLGVSLRTVEQMRADGTLAVVRHGRAIRVELSELERLVATRRERRGVVVPTPIRRPRRVQPAELPPGFKLPFPQFAREQS